MKTKYVLGIDIGGTETKIGVVKCLSKTQFSLEMLKSIPTICGQQNINKMIKDIFDEIETMKLHYPKVESCGVAVAGLVDYKNGVVIYAPNIFWRNLKLKNIIEKKLKMSVVIDNDANLATLAVYHNEILPKYPKVKNVVCLTLGTGIGGGIILNGELYHGSNGTAAELGHVIVEPFSNKQCGCGNKGCVERFIGARWFIEDIISLLKKEKPKTILYKLLDNKLNNLTPKILFEAAQKNDKFSLQQWRYYGRYLGIAISSVINVLNPEVIVFTGGVSLAYKYFIQEVKKEVKTRIWPIIERNNPVGTIKWYIAKSKNQGVLGAGILAYKTFL